MFPTLPQINTMVVACEMNRELTNKETVSRQIFKSSSVNSVVKEFRKYRLQEKGEEDMDQIARTGFSFKEVSCVLTHPGKSRRKSTTRNARSRKDSVQLMVDSFDYFGVGVVLYQSESCKDDGLDQVPEALLVYVSLSFQYLLVHLLRRMVSVDRGTQGSAAGKRSCSLHLFGAVKSSHGYQFSTVPSNIHE